MIRRLMIGYGCLVVIPTLMLGAAARVLLERENDRLNAATLSAVRTRAGALAEAVATRTRSTQSDVTAFLKQLPPSARQAQLSRWAASDALIRNVFLMTSDGGLALPPEGQAALPEERRFRSRYAALFEGRLPWADPAADTVPDTAASRMFSRQTDDDAPTLQMTAGWRCWFSENRLYLLGWVQDNHVIWGAELELMALLSRLIPLFPDTVAPGLSLALVDDSGRLLHQVGTAEILPESTPVLSVSLSPALPHWAIAVYGRAVDAGPARSGFLLISTLILATFLTAILAGGGLMLWQARKNYRDARRKTSFVANVSHELKTPLTTIRMYAELLQEDRVPDPEKRRQYLSVIINASARLGRLINNVLDFSRLERGEKRYQIQQVDVSRFLHPLLDQAESWAAASGVTLRRDLATGLWVRVDPDGLSQVVLNLIDNAVKYAASGGEVCIRATASPEGAVCIAFCDRGPGIPEKDQQRIFDSFHRLDTSLTSDKPGCGLGLTISRQIIRNFSGDLFCTDNPAGGACFEIRLPAVSGGDR